MTRQLYNCNLLVTNGLFHPYQMGESTLIFRGIKGNISFLFHFSMTLGRRNLRCTIWGYSVCICPVKRTQGLNGLILRIGNKAKLTRSLIFNGSFSLKLNVELRKWTLKNMYLTFKTTYFMGITNKQLFLTLYKTKIPCRKVLIGYLSNSFFLTTSIKNWIELMPKYLHFDRQKLSGVSEQLSFTPQFLVWIAKIDFFLENKSCRVTA